LRDGRGRSHRGGRGTDERGGREGRGGRGRRGGRTLERDHIELNRGRGDSLDRRFSLTPGGENRDDLSDTGSSFSGGRGGNYFPRGGRGRDSAGRRFDGERGGRGRSGRWPERGSGFEGRASRDGRGRRGGRDSPVEGRRGRGDFRPSDDRIMEATFTGRSESGRGRGVEWGRRGGGRNDREGRARCEGRSAHFRIEAPTHSLPVVPKLLDSNALGKHERSGSMEQKDSGNKRNRESLSFGSEGEILSDVLIPTNSFSSTGRGVYGEPISRDHIPDEPRRSQQNLLASKVPFEHAKATAGLPDSERGFERNQETRPVRTDETSLSAITSFRTEKGPSKGNQASHQFGSRQGDMLYSTSLDRNETATLPNRSIPLFRHADDSALSTDAPSMRDAVPHRIPGEASGSGHNFTGIRTGSFSSEPLDRMDRSFSFGGRGRQGRLSGRGREADAGKREAWRDSAPPAMLNGNRAMATGRGDDFSRRGGPGRSFRGGLVGRSRGLGDLGRNALVRGGRGTDRGTAQHENIALPWQQRRNGLSSLPVNAVTRRQRIENRFDSHVHHPIPNLHSQHAVNRDAPSKDMASPKDLLVSTISITSPEQGPTRSATPPPEPSKPSGYIVALTRLADMEAQMEYAFAKHLHLSIEQKKLRAQYGILEGLPVGIDAVKEDLDNLHDGNDQTKLQEAS
jgi:hypothetical protein